MKNVPCRRNSEPAGPEASSGSENDKGSDCRWKQVVGARDARCFRRPYLCRVKGQAADGGFLRRATGSHYSSDGWLTKSDLHFEDISWLHTGYGGCISGPRGGCREASRELLQQHAKDNGPSD